MTKKLEYFKQIVFYSIICGSGLFFAIYGNFLDISWKELNNDSLNYVVGMFLFYMILMGISMKILVMKTFEYLDYRKTTQQNNAEVKEK